MQIHVPNLKFNKKLGVIFGLLVSIFLTAACTTSQEPVPTQVPPTSTPPPLEIPGRWTTYVAENMSHERDGVVVTAKQLRFGTTNRLFPNAVESDLAEFGLNDVKGVVAVFIEIENKNGDTVEIFPGGDTASILLNSGEQLSPIKSLSNVGRSIRGGNTRSFLVVFPIYETNLGDIRETLYTFDGLEFNYTELPDVRGPRL